MNFITLHKFRRSDAFTLAEALAVMAIISILAALSVPAISSLKNSGNVNRAINGISLLLDQARAYAMAHDTYVWVGFATQTTTQQLLVGLVAGTSGNSTDLESTSTYTPIAPIQSYDQMSLKSLTGLSGMSTSADPIFSSQLGSFQQNRSGLTVTFSDVLQFGPQGEATIGIVPRDGTHCIQIGLQPIQGGNAAGANKSVIQVADLTGQVQVFRP